jgi:TRAP-type C4-dicarboxylate transport system permease large subunit
MKSKRRSPLTYANMVASVALFAALGGSSYAAVAITGQQVRDGSLSGRDGP